MTRLVARLAAVSAAALLLSACANAVQRLESVGQAPQMSPIMVPQMPAEAPRQANIAASGQPSADGAAQRNSLWRTGARAFFRDQRAARVGDILTVEISIADSASVTNTSARSRTSGESAGLDHLLGLEDAAGAILPGGYDPANAVELTADSNSEGTGTVDRSEEIDLTIAAVVTGVLPNGNLVIEGRQEVRVNYEVRELLISGIVRPEDISNGNTVKNTQIAEARISYGGRGQITDVQQPRYGQQVLDVLLPF